MGGGVALNQYDGVLIKGCIWAQKQMCTQEARRVSLKAETRWHFYGQPKEGRRRPANHPKLEGRLGTASPPPPGIHQPRWPTRAETTDCSALSHRSMLQQPSQSNTAQPRGSAPGPQGAATPPASGGLMHSLLPSCSSSKGHLLQEPSSELPPELFLHEPHS